MGGLTDMFKSPKMPDALPSVSLPDPSDAKVVQAGKRKKEEERARTGRESTDLGGGSGAPVTYGNSTLGT